MEADKPIELPSEEVSLPESGVWAKLPLAGGVVGVAALLLAFLAGERQQVAFSYLAGFAYWLTLALGGLFFVLLHYLARSGWSVVVRRLAEHVAATLPLFALLFLPIAFSLHELYHWSHAEAVESDPLLHHKAAYLNPGFFYLRAVFYLAVWSGLALFFRRESMRQDTSGDPAITARLRTWSAPGMLLFGVTLTFAAFDWLMSLEPHWFSTIFGVYVFAGSVVGIFSLLILLVIQLQRGGRLTSVVTGEHYHDLGKLLFGFIVFWAYIGFSQFMLIWYANIPEETFWFDMRWQHGWRPVSIFLAVGHFVVPFFYLISQPVKRNRTALTVITLWLLFMHYVDVYWLTMPTLHHGEAFRVSWLDPVCWLGVGALFVAVFAQLLRRRPLVPLRDPRLAESLSFESV